MRILSWYAWIFINLNIIFFACQNRGKTENNQAHSALDATRFFLESALKGDKEQTRQYIIKDSLNEFLLNKWETKFKQLPDSEKNNYRKASIIIEKDSILSDSSEIISFRNSYRKQSYKLKAYKINGVYKIDLKYIFYGDENLF